MWGCPSLSQPQWLQLGAGRGGGTSTSPGNLQGVPPGHGHAIGSVALTYMVIAGSLFPPWLWWMGLWTSPARRTAIPSRGQCTTHHIYVACMCPLGTLRGCVACMCLLGSLRGLLVHCHCPHLLHMCPHGSGSVGHALPGAGRVHPPCHPPHLHHPHQPHPQLSHPHQPPHPPLVGLWPRPWISLAMGPTWHAPMVVLVPHVCLESQGRAWSGCAVMASVCQPSPPQTEGLCAMPCPTQAGGGRLHHLLHQQAPALAVLLCMPFPSLRGLVLMCYPGPSAQAATEGHIAADTVRHTVEALALWPKGRGSHSG